MRKDTFLIDYPAIYAGTEKSEIFFCKGTPDLISVFNPGEAEENSPRRFFVTDATVASLDCMKDFIAKFDDNTCGKDNLIILGSGEPYKTIETVLRIVTAAVDAGFTRKDIFVGIGGGVICDTTAFAASIFKRGAKVQLVPTTLLAMVDASIGGKTGCDYDSYKNTIGTFFPAEKLYYFPEFIQYLPENQYNSGLAESFKTALLFNRQLYDIFKNESEKINNRDKDLLDTIIRECVKAKATIVEKDFTEKNIRSFLNLGHTFGHALESVAGLGIVTHGAAVAWGIGRCVDLSYKMDYCKEGFRNEIYSILELYGWETAPVHSVIKGGEVGKRLLSVMHKDKKNISDSVRVVIQKALPEENIQDITKLSTTVVEEISDDMLLKVLK